MSIYKRISIFGLTMALAAMSSLSFAADNSAVIGKWDIALNAQGQSINIDLTITQGENGLEGIWTGPQGSSPVSEISYEGDTLKVTRAGQQGALTLVFEVDGDTVSGNLTTPGGELPVTGKKVM